MWQSYCNTRGSTAQLLQYSEISTKQFHSHVFFCDSPLLHLFLSGLQKVIQDNHALALYQLCRNQLIIPDLPSILCPISIITRTLNTNHHTLFHVFLNVSPKLFQHKYKYRGHKRCISNKSQVCVLAGVCTGASG